jgi:hypothetical protein
MGGLQVLALLSRKRKATNGSTVTGTTVDVSIVERSVPFF